MFKSLSRKERMIAVADIGSASGGVCILSIAKGRPAEVLAAERCRLPLEERTREATLRGIEEKLTEAAQKALDIAKRSPSFTGIHKGYAIVRGPWTRSKSVSSEYPLENSTRINEALISKFALETIGKDNEFDTSTVMEAAVMRVELDGYPTLRPAGKVAHSLMVAVLLSNMEKSVRELVERVFLSALNVPSPTFRSGLRAIIASLKEGAALPKDCVIIDMTSEATHLVAVRKGILSETAVVPEGMQSILRRISGKRPPEETLNLLRLIEMDQCEKDTCEEIQAAIGRTEPELARIFGEVMGTMAAKRRLPNALIVTAHQDIIHWISNVFARIDFSQFTTTSQPFSPKSITPEGLAEFVRSHDQRSDLGLMLAASLVNIEEKH